MVWKLTKITALIPESCWKNIKPSEISSGFKLLRLQSSNSAFWDAWRSASQWDFTIPFNSGSTSAFLPRNHCNARRARSSRPRETNHLKFKVVIKLIIGFNEFLFHLGVSGISSMRIRKGIGSAAPRKANCDQLRYLPTTKHINIPMLPNAVGSRPSVPRTYLRIIEG